MVANTCSACSLGVESFLFLLKCVFVDYVVPFFPLQKSFDKLLMNKRSKMWEGQWLDAKVAL